jgi:hypothetical protein
MASTGNYTLDWEEFMKSSADFVTAWASKFASYPIPSLEHFMLYDGNITDWMERLNKAWSYPAADDNQALTNM